MTKTRLIEQTAKKADSSKELIEQIAKKADISQAAAGRALKAVVNGIRIALKEGNAVTLVGFGTFKVGKRVASTGRKPRTAAVVEFKPWGDQTPPEKAASAQVQSAEAGWQELLESGLESTKALLTSKEFRSPAEASELLRIREPAVHEFIRDGKLFSVKMPGDGEGEHRIPIWALDTVLTGQVTSNLLKDAAGADEWDLYDFLTTPNGSLNGLRPFECLVSRESLPSSKKAARDELATYLKVDATASLLEPVRRAMKNELEERRSA